MSQKERERLGMMQLLERGEIMQQEAARLLGITPRQVRRLQERWHEKGDAGLVHRARGRTSNRAYPAALRQRALELLARHYADFGPTLAAETLAERHGLVLDHETLRRWMSQAGQWAGARRLARPRRLRPRRAALGELVQMDTSIHAWLEGRGPKLVLIGMIDDATSRLWVRFAPADTTVANLALLKDYVERFGRPRALYTDQASHFVSPAAPDAPQSYRGQRPLTQIGRALAELDIALIAARSPQAKGRIERAWRTMQERLVRGLRLAGVATLAAANEYLEQVFVPWWNRTLAVAPASPSDAHRALLARHDLAAILSVQQERCLMNDWTVQYGAVRLQVLASGGLKGLRPGARLLVEDRLDGSLKLRWRGQYLEWKRVSRNGLAGAAPGVGGSVGLRPPSPPTPGQPLLSSPKA